MGDDIVAPRPTISCPECPADGMTMNVPVGDGVLMTIVDPRSFSNGGPEWVMRYGNPESIRYTVAGLIETYDYLLSGRISMTEATRRLRLMRGYRKAAAIEEHKP